MLNSTLITRFNTAADLFSKGKFSEALEAYQSLFEPTDSADVEAPSESFCLEIRMRIASCLIELGDFIDARFELENEHTRQLIAYAGPSQLEAYHFTYGNILAKVGEYDFADTNLAKAQQIALIDLQDLNAVDRIFRFRLHWANHYNMWSNLLNLAQESHRFAEAQGLVALMHWSSEAVCFALKGLHQYAEAKHYAEGICARLEKSGARHDHIAVWTKFISDLSA